VEVDGWTETFFGILQVANPVRPRQPASRKRVLRGAGASLAAKRRQRVRRPCDRAPKTADAKADGVSRSGRQHRSRRDGLATPTSPGSESRACTRVDSPGTWETSTTLRKRAVGGRGNKSPAGRRILRSRERKWMHPQYRGAKATKRSGMAVEESERVTVPLKAGNRTAGTRWRERLAVTRTCCEER